MTVAVTIFVTMGTAVRSANPFRTLGRHRNFRLFWFGQTISLVGTWMQQIATGWLALQLTNSAYMVGLVAALGSLPILLFSLPAGVLADRSDKLRIVRIAQSLMLVEASVLWWFAWSGHMSIQVLLALVLAGGILSSIEIPARQSLIIDLVVKEDLLDAIALNSGGFNLARILGPTVAALVIASLGLSWCFGFNALSYLAVLVGLALIRLPKAVLSADATAYPSAVAGMREALRYVRNDRIMWILMRIVTVFSILSVPILTLLPVVARDQLHLDVSGYGLLMTCYGVGATLGALAIASQGGKLKRGRTLTISSLGLGLTILAFSLSHSVIFCGVMLFALGVAVITNNALINTLLQHRVPNELRGRVMSIYVMVYIGMNPIGSYLGGWVASYVGAQWAIGGMAAPMVIFTIWAFRRYSELRRA
jgi:MFS family permease